MLCLLYPCDTSHETGAEVCSSRSPYKEQTSIKVELLTWCHWTCTLQALVEAFYRRAALYTPEWNKEHTAGKMLVKLKKQICAWLYFTFLEIYYCDQYRHNFERSVWESHITHAKYLSKPLTRWFFLLRILSLWRHRILCPLWLLRKYL